MRVGDLNTFGMGVPNRPHGVHKTPRHSPSDNPWAQTREGELVTCNVYQLVDYTALTLRVSPHVALLPHNNSTVIYTHVMTEQRVYLNYLICSKMP